MQGVLSNINNKKAINKRNTDLKIKKEQNKLDESMDSDQIVENKKTIKKKPKLSEA